MLFMVIERFKGRDPSPIYAGSAIEDVLYPRGFGMSTVGLRPTSTVAFSSWNVTTR